MNEDNKIENKPYDICDRTFQFALRIINLCTFLNEKPGVARELSKQLIRSGTSIGANLQESQSAQSTADFIHKLEIALKEAKETKYWLSLINSSKIVTEDRLISLINEINELIKILSTIIIKKKQNAKTNKNQKF